jgi:hypothetical protein
MVGAGSLWPEKALQGKSVLTISGPLSDNYELWKTDCCIKCGQEKTSLEEEGITSNNSLLYVALASYIVLVSASILYSWSLGLED